MYHNFEVPENCLNLWTTCRSLIPELLKGCTVKTSDLKIVKSKPIDPTVNSVYLMKNGMISEMFQGQVMVNYEEGDLIGVDAIFNKKLTKFENDFAVTVDEYDGVQLLNEIFRDKGKFLIWNQFLSCLNQSQQLIISHLTKAEIEFNPEFRHYDSDDVIIEENTEGDEVFTLMSGSAKVMFNHTEVGSVEKNEIFGAIAAITNTKRTASIVATSSCETIVVKKDNFRDLLTSRPDTTQQLIGDMARTIVACNEKISHLSKGDVVIKEAK